ncbi:MAG: glycosyltransferase family 4 protein, partial [Anaerolineales bacterium]|nr:glycosyltransferase family 4 protein [Anaerolineales bacterium]
MRAALVICGELSEPTGGFMYDRFLMDELNHLGVETEIVSFPWDRYARQLVDNFDRHWRDRLNSLDVDLILQDELCHPALVGLNRWAFGPDSPPKFGIVHHLRCLEQHPPLLLRLYRWIERAYLATLDAYIFNSDHTRDHTFQILGDERPAVVAHPGKDHMSAQPGQLHEADTETSPQLLFVGGLTRRKGLDSLLDALLGLTDLPWELQIVGRTDLDPTYAEKIKERAKQFSDPKRIMIHGHLERPLLERRYRRADLLVVPSQLEGFGMVYLEAMGYGLPVIATTNGGAAELIDHGHNGFLVPPNSPPILTEILRALLQDRDLRRSIGRAARSRFEEHPTWRATGKRV